MTSRLGRARPVRLTLAGVTVVLAAAASLLGSSAASAAVAPPQFNCVPSQATVFSNPDGVLVPDPPAPGFVTSTIAVGGVVGTVYDVDVLTKIVHAAPTDLEIVVTSPQGTSVVLSRHNGAANAFNGTTWDDDADPDGLSTATTNDGLVTDHAFVAGVVASPLVPQGALARFSGEDPNGIWTLTVRDVVAGNVGLLDDWSLAFATDDAVSLRGVAVGSTAATVDVANGGTASLSMPLASVNRTVEALSISLTSLSTAALGDLTLTVRSPAGTLVTLTSGNGGTRSLTSVTLTWLVPSRQAPSTGAVEPISLTDFTLPALPAEFVPEESFGALTGEDPDGTWVVTLTDGGRLPGGATLGGLLLRTSGGQCAGSARLGLVTGPAPGTRVGDRVTYETSATSSGTGFARDITLTLAMPPQFRIAAIDPDAGAVCERVEGAGIKAVCTWTGPTAPGATRRLRVVGEVFIAGRISVASTMAAALVGGTSPAYAGSNRAAAHSDAIDILASNVRASNGARCTVLGTPAADDFRTITRLVPPPVYGPATGQVYCGRGGNDRITAGPLNDVVDGGAGRDVLKGGLGNDRMFGGSGADVILGGAGADDLRGGRGRDRLFGEAGRDRLNGGPGRDVIVGGRGRDSAIRSRGDTLISVERIR